MKGHLKLSMRSHDIQYVNNGYGRVNIFLLYTWHDVVKYQFVKIGTYYPAVVKTDCIRKQKETKYKANFLWNELYIASCYIPYD